MNLFDLSGKTAVITGARRGIGRAIAEAFAGAGADIVAASAHESADGGEVGAAVRAQGRSFTGHAVDFTDITAVTQFAESVRGADILVNNAGTIRRSPSAEHPWEWWEEVIQVNLSAQFAMAQIVGRDMVSRAEGRIIFMASLLTFQGGLRVPGYAASKSGIAGLVHALSNEWAPHGVNVNGIAPGFIETDNTGPLRNETERAQTILERIPAGRWGQPDDVAGAAVFLASPAAAYVSGAILPVDGGWLAS